MTSELLDAHRSIVLFMAILCMPSQVIAQNSVSLTRDPKNVGIFRLYDLTNTKFGKDDSGLYGIDRLMLLELLGDGKLRGSVYSADGSDSIWEVTGKIPLPGSLDLQFRSKNGLTIHRTLNYFPDNGNFYTREFRNLLHARQSSLSDPIAPNVARFQRAELCDEKCVVVVPKDNDFTGYKSIPFADFFGVNNEVSFGPEVDDFRVVAKDSIEDFKSYVLFFGGTIEVEGQSEESYHVHSKIPAIMRQLYERNLLHSKMLTVDSEDCKWTTDKFDTLSCTLRNRTGLDTKNEIFYLKILPDKDYDSLHFSSDAGNKSLKGDIKYLYLPRMIRDSAPLTSPLVKVIFDKQTFIKEGLQTANDRADLVKSLKKKLFSFCAVVARECSISSGDSSGTALNLNMIGNSINKDVFSKGYWWKLTIEFIFSSDQDLRNSSISYDTVQLHFQDLNLAKSPVDKRPPDGAWRSLPTVLESGGETNSNGNPIPDLVRDMADKLAELYGGARLSSVTSDFSSSRD